MISRVLVIGGAGFIGSHIVDLLQKEGLPVRVFDSFESGSKDNLPDGIDLVIGDIRDAGAVKEAMRGVSHVVHLAALVSVPLSVAEPKLTHDINTEGTRTVLAAARDAGIQGVVLASSAAVYGDDPEMPKREYMPAKPLSPYAVSKLENERDALKSTEDGIPVIALRFFNVYGPRQKGNHPYASAVARFKEAAESGAPVQIFGDGSQTRDFVHVKDVARAIRAALDAPHAAGGVFNIASGTTVSLNDVLSYIEEARAAAIERIYLPERAGDLKDSSADITRAKHALGYAPQVSVKEGIIELFS